MKRKSSVNKLSIYRFRNADACELLSKKGGYGFMGGDGGFGPDIPQPDKYNPVIAF
jgi:hypothetical protein